MRVLAVVARFKWSHIDYLAALAREADLWVAWSGSGHSGAPEHALRKGMSGASVGTLKGEGPDVVSAALAEVLDRVRPDVIHVMYYHHEALTLMIRALAPRTPIVWECRDPLTTLERARPGSEHWALEAGAISAADGHILVSEALRLYLQASHGVDLASALIVPHAFAARNAGPVRAKLSAQDGRTHIALVGTANDLPGHGRYYVDIIRRLVGMGFVVHSHFHEEIEGTTLEPYRALDEELADYHHHPTVSFRDGHRLSDLTSRYDLMGVFHELDAPAHNEAPTLEVCMPTKAVSAWFHGAIPVVTFKHYRGLVEQVERRGIGFVAADWPAVGRLVGDRVAIDRATAACLESRAVFSHEFQARRIAEYYERVFAGGVQ